MGEGCLVAGGVFIGGSATIEDYVTIAGKSDVGPHVTIGIRRPFLQHVLVCSSLCLVQQCMQATLLDQLKKNKKEMLCLLDLKF